MTIAWEYYHSMLRKNLINFHKVPIEQVGGASGLFNSKQSKERVLEQLKRGTLFRWNRRKQTETTHPQSITLFQEPKSWIQDIKLGIGNHTQQPQPKIIQHAQKKKRVARLPHISKFRASPVQSHNLNIEKRCDKVTCLTKKLSKVAAWNHQNSKSIHNNISKLEKSLNLQENTLIQDDFSKIQGVNTTQDKSLESSLLFLDKQSIIENGSTFNPFSKFPNFQRSIGQWQRERRRDKQNKDVSEHCYQRLDEGSYIPTFLMSSILVQTPRSQSPK